MTHQEQEAVKALLNGKSWLLVEAMLYEELNISMKIDINKPHQDIAIDTIAGVKLQETVKRFINRLNNIKNGKTNAPVNYK
jgi:CBS domain containing-hemolysin-like protein